METRRVALVTESFYPAVDSATTTVRSIADYLIDHGHEVRIIAPAPGLSSYRRAGVARIRPFAKPGAQVRESLAAFAPDLVQVTSPGRIGRRALKHAQALGVPTLTVQQSVVGDLEAEYWLARVAAPSDHLVTTCRWMHTRLLGLGVSAPVWLPGVDTAAFAPQLRDDWLHAKWSRRRSATGPRVVVGYVGSLHKRNGVRRLPEVAALPGVRMVVIGSGTQRSWLRDAMPGAKFVGSLETGDLATAIASLDVLVHPGTEETDCHALREAAASGVPVVAPAAAGALDVVRDGETGVLYDPAVPDGLAAAVTGLVTDRRWRADLGAQARARVADRDWRQATEELVTTHFPQARALPGVRSLH